MPAPLEDRDGITELDFTDTSALSDADAFERRRQSGKNGLGSEAVQEGPSEGT